MSARRGNRSKSGHREPIHHAGRVDGRSMRGDPPGTPTTGPNPPAGPTGRNRPGPEWRSGQSIGQAVEPAGSPQGQGRGGREIGARLKKGVGAGVRSRSRRSGDGEWSRHPPSRKRPEGSVAGSRTSRRKAHSGGRSSAAGKAGATPTFSSRPAPNTGSRGGAARKAAPARICPRAATIPDPHASPDPRRSIPAPRADCSPPGPSRACTSPGPGARRVPRPGSASRVGTRLRSFREIGVSEMRMLTQEST